MPLPWWLLLRMGMDQEQHQSGCNKQDDSTHLYPVKDDQAFRVEFPVVRIASEFDLVFILFMKSDAL